MKKFVSLLLSVVLLATMLTVFAVPASAEKFRNDCEIASGSYDNFHIESRTTVTVNGSVTINEHSSIKIARESKLIIDENGYLQGNGIEYFSGLDTSSIEVKDGGGFNIEFRSSDDIDRFTTFLEKNGIEYCIDGNSVKSLCKVHRFEKGKCSVCGYVCQHNNGFDTNYKCNICKWECEHEKWNNGKCELCQYECRHNDGYTAGKCNICQQECKHGNTFTKTFCSDCGEEVKNTTPAVGSALSEGNMAIIIGIVAFVLGLGVMFFIMKKKKLKNEIHNS